MKAGTEADYSLVVITASKLVMLLQFQNFGVPPVLSPITLSLQPSTFFLNAKTFCKGQNRHGEAFKSSKGRTNKRCFDGAQARELQVVSIAVAIVMSLSLASN